MATEVVRHWTVEELFRDAGPPTDDDVPIALDGRLLDTPEKVIAYLDEINRNRAAPTAWQLTRRSIRAAYSPRSNATADGSSARASKSAEQRQTTPPSSA